MHKKIIFIILWFFILNIFSINAFYNTYIWNNLYSKNEYNDSIKYFKNAWNKEWYYNIANIYYKEKKYNEAIKEYRSILWDEKNKINFNINHNIANSFYKIWEIETDNTKKIKNWEESIKYYTDALNIKYDEETKKNLEFVLNKIKEIKKNNKENNKENQENKKNNESNKWDDNKNQEW
jgi:tetratricopeptide (TPR) repeat protein